MNVAQLQQNRSEMYCAVCKQRTRHERINFATALRRWRCVKCWSFQAERGKEYRINPRRLSLRDSVKNNAEMKRAAKLLTDFTGHAPTKVRRVRIKKSSNVRIAIGRVTAIMYLARDGKKTVHYIHRFRAGSRPSLSATPDGKTLELLGGAFRFTDRGIVDK